jgi:TetR/AcrR family transcriptional regulator
MRRTGADSKNTRQRILRHSMAEFASKGYDGARVDSIAHRCRLSKNMLYHYFNSKEGLFIAVLENAYETFRARQRDFAIRGSDPVDAMCRLIDHTFYAFLENQDVIALLNTANLHKGRHIRHSRLIRSLYDPLVDTVREILRRGAAEGVFRPKIDPVNLYLSLSSLSYNYISNQYTLKVAFGIDLMTKSRRAIWLAHITDLILTYCRVKPRSR